jgi:hypothetical protein
MSFHDVTFSDASPINFSFSYKERERGVAYSNVLVASFDGEYRPGSAGAPDAMLIRGITQAAVTVWSPAGLVLDLRKLHYEWGDEMDMLLGPPDGLEIPTAVVGSELCLPAIATLMFGVNTTKRATEQEGVFDALDAALAYVEAQLKEERVALSEKYPPLPRKSWGLLSWIRKN